MKAPGYGAVVAVMMLAGAWPAASGDGQSVKGEFPWCRAIYVESPDRRWLLGSKCTINCPPGDDKNWDRTSVPACSRDPSNELFLENAATHRKRPIAFDGYAGNAVWSPDSAAFFINNHSASDQTDASLYLADSPQRIDVKEAIFRSDPSTAHYRFAHRYFSALKWLDDRTALVRLCGHTDAPPPVVEFDIRYQVSLDGKAKKLSEHLSPATMSSHDCD